MTRPYKKLSASAFFWGLWESAEINAYRQVGTFFCLEEFVGISIW
jgi:hypothetical protein